MWLVTPTRVYLPSPSSSGWDDFSTTLFGAFDVVLISNIIQNNPLLSPSSDIGLLVMGHYIND